MSTGLPLLDLMRPVYMRWPVDPDGHVIEGEPLETLVLRDAKSRHLYAAIELHPSDDGRWMWATQFTLRDSGGGYKVGPKWGRFAATRDAALRCGAEEIIERLDERHSGERDPFVRKVKAWALGLCQGVAA